MDHFVESGNRLIKIGVRQVQSVLESGVQEWYSKAKQGRYSAIVIGSYYDATPMQVVRCGRGGAAPDFCWPRAIPLSVK